MMNTADQLQQIFADNFVSYYRSHAAHANIVGRNFYSDHKLLQKIYEDLQGQIDTIAEILRTLDEYMPASIDAILSKTHIDLAPIEGNSDSLLGQVEVDLDHLVSCYQDLEKVAAEEGLEHIGNYAQERVLALQKFVWMLKSTLE